MRPAAGAACVSPQEEEREEKENLAKQVLRYHVYSNRCNNTDEVNLG